MKGISYPRIVSPELQKLHMLSVNKCIRNHCSALVIHTSCHSKFWQHEYFSHPRSEFTPVHGFPFSRFGFPRNFSEANNFSSNSSEYGNPGTGGGLGRRIRTYCGRSDFQASPIFAISPPLANFRFRSLLPVGHFRFAFVTSRFHNSRLLLNLQFRPVFLEQICWEKKEKNCRT